MQKKGLFLHILFINEDKLYPHFDNKTRLFVMKNKNKNLILSKFKVRHITNFKKLRKFNQYWKNLWEESEMINLILS